MGGYTISIYSPGDSLALSVRWIVIRRKLAAIIKHNSELPVLELYHLAVAVAAILVRE